MASPDPWHELFEDLEQQAEALAMEQRDLDVEELSRAEYAEVDARARWHASVGRVVELDVEGAERLRGRLSRVGAGWLLLSAEESASVLGSTSRGDAAAQVVALPAVLAARGLSWQGVPRSAQGLAAGLGIGSALRRLAAADPSVVLRRRDGVVRVGRLGRVGADFVELVIEEGARALVELVPFAALATVSGEAPEGR